ncbi:hypothetical protein PR003_g13001 [Phytophthora rubi]|uniref:Pectate lyase n=1 Tax=Phytophthora rubi TaxID=129364 RepID=A0A6A3N4Z7_9STRA|nr:hypothetical protein PR002_g24478 [Phytophthora rubi]KAE9036022.1 hypothetical protein PR001_g9044 [Phytophthora rubi]KAE9335462.1 hypothetical protein PR003_g13001 [Phytophthora rubi]
MCKKNIKFVYVWGLANFLTCYHVSGSDMNTFVSSEPPTLVNEGLKSVATKVTPLSNLTS